ncbi:putative Calcium-binding EF-hand family protein [Hibiscus syriacus]|uniref:Calcium-binding EF-hand family protein n=1 Tax=Hibiscus syriacus TaxID=106335 RepID=A0A6A2ZYN0_HIBSY|nr:putative Calcium-binding EF-hand family protein [Hibiscus syriacus]
MSEESKEIEEQRVLSDLINAVNLVEKQASSCYADHDFAAELGDEFVKTMLLDSVFIIELFRKGDEEVKEPGGPIFSMACMLQFLQHDLILLENQIPWLVLEILFEKTRLPYETKSLIELALWFFANTFTSHLPPELTFSGLEGKDMKHILDLLRLSLVLPSREMKSLWPFGWRPIRPVSRLKEGGLKFKKCVSDSVLDISTINDLEILSRSEFFDNWLSPEDSVQFFNNLYKGTYVKEFYYAELGDKLNWHCESLDHKLIRVLPLAPTATPREQSDLDPSNGPDRACHRHRDQS